MAATHAAFHQALDDWWRVSVSAIEGLAHSNNVFNLRRRFVDTIAAALTPLGLLNVHEVRGAMANYFKTLEADFKSIAASGWNAELIPDDEILASQFPDVLEQVARAEARIAELQALFAAADSEEESDGEGDDETGLLPAGEAAQLRKQIGEQSARLKLVVKEAKGMVDLLATRARHAQLLSAGQAKSAFTAGLAGREPDFASVERILAVAALADLEPELAGQLRAQAEEGRQLQESIAQAEARLARHKALEDELRLLKQEVKAVARRQDELVAQARSQIDPAAAQALILARLHRLLHEQYDDYLRRYRRELVAAVETLWDKYAVTARDILAERDRAAAELERFLVELGYE